MIDVQEKKEKIIQFLKDNGPSLPVRIGHAIQMDPMIAVAITSELIGSSKVKTSNMKIGSSPLYLLPGQEEKLVDFTENLKTIERQTIEKLKQKKILSDEEQEPATRVALRAIKDFASPFRHDGKIMWKYAFLNDEQAREIMQSPNSNEQKETIETIENKADTELKETRTVQEKEEIFREEDDDEEEKEEPIKNEEENTTKKEEAVPKAWEIKKEEAKQKQNKPEIEKETKIENIFSKDDKQPEPEFLVEVKNFLKKKNIEFLEEIRTEKKEVMAKVRISSQLGDINMLLIAKDKKTTNKDEIRASVQMSTNTDMPCLLIIRKEPTKSIQNLLENNSLIKIEVMGQE